MCEFRKKLRIAFLSSGTLAHVRCYLEFFRERGHDVHWITTDRPQFETDIPIHDISRGVDPNNSLTKWRYLWSGMGVRKVLKAIRPDVLHGFYATSSGVIACMAGFSPSIISVQGSDLIASMPSSIWRTVLKLVFARSSLVHTVSDQLTQLAVQLGVPASKTLTLTQGVDTSLFAFDPKTFLGEPVRLLCTRTLAEVYNPRTIVEACSILHHKGFPFRLTFAGQGPLEADLRRIVLDENLDTVVSFGGGYENRQLPRLFSEHDLYVSASSWDGTSVSLLEAMAVGMFPVVSRIPSNQSWLQDGRTALMFECQNPTEMAGRLMEAASRDDFRQSAILANRRLIQEKADRRQNMLALEKTYHQLYSNAANPRGQSARP